MDFETQCYKTILLFKKRGLVQEYECRLSSNVVSNGQDWSPRKSFILKGSQSSALQLKGGFKSKTSTREYKNEMQNSYQTCAWIIWWYMFWAQREESKINHMLIPLFALTILYTCWFLWQAYYIEDCKWRLRFQFGVAFRRVVLREVLYFEGPSRVWRASRTSILNNGHKHRPPLLLGFFMASALAFEWRRRAWIKNVGVTGLLVTLLT